VEVVLEAGALDGNEMVCDFKALKDALGDYLQTFDHALCVNTDDPNFAQLKAAYGAQVIPFAGEDPTTEVMARAIFAEAKKRLTAYAASGNARYPIAKGVRLASVKVWETSSSWAEYAEQG
jgi:6-pyruvoyltetrahydropterin/6-carboxytetrahydropterin synthase